MPKNKQTWVTLDGFHEWAIGRVASAMNVTPSIIVTWAVRDWVEKHSEHVGGVGATLAEYARTKKPPESPAVT